MAEWRRFGRIDVTPLRYAWGEYMLVVLMLVGFCLLVSCPANGGDFDHAINWDHRGAVRQAASHRQLLDVSALVGTPAVPLTIEYRVRRDPYLVGLEVVRRAQEPEVIVVVAPPPAREDWRIELARVCPSCPGTASAR